MNASKALMELLKGYGVREVFGLPGETTLPLYKEWISTPEVKHVMMRDERSAAFAADAYARLLQTRYVRGTKRGRNSHDPRRS